MSIQLGFSQGTKLDLPGTWHLSAVASYSWGTYTIHKDYVFYVDGRYHTLSESGLPDNGNWKVESNLLVLISDSFGEDSYKILSSGQLLRISSNLIFTAKKTSIYPQRLLQKDILGNIKRFPRSISNVFEINALCGTWKAKNLADHSTFSFTIYPDQRWLNSYGVDGTWVLDGNKIYWYVDYEDYEAPPTTITSQFSTKHWSYSSVKTGARYQAERVSPIPQRYNIPPPPPCRGVCVFCSGEGKGQCGICGGLGGSRDYLGNWVPCNGSVYPCQNGKTKCHMCNGTGKCK